MSKLKLLSYSKSYLGHSYDIKLSIQNNERREIIENYGRGTVQVISFDILSI